MSGYTPKFRGSRPYKQQKGSYNYKTELWRQQQSEQSKQSKFISLVVSAKSPGSVGQAKEIVDQVVRAFNITADAFNMTEALPGNSTEQVSFLSSSGSVFFPCNEGALTLMPSDHCLEEVAYDQALSSSIPLNSSFTDAFAKQFLQHRDSSVNQETLGIVLGSVTGLLAVSALLCCYYARKKRDQVEVPEVARPLLETPPSP